jgi:hypothetical protein
MRGDPHSYQSIAAWMPDDIDHNYLDQPCSISHCGYQAVEQDWYDADLCEDHLKDEVEWDRADRVSE